MLPHEERAAVSLYVRMVVAGLKQENIDIERLRFATYAARHELTDRDVVRVSHLAQAECFAILEEEYGSPKN